MFDRITIEMLRAIELDDELMRKADEVNHVRVRSRPGEGTYAR